MVKRRCNEGLVCLVPSLFQAQQGCEVGLRVLQKACEEPSGSIRKVENVGGGAAYGGGPHCVCSSVRMISHCLLLL